MGQNGRPSRFIKLSVFKTILIIRFLVFAYLLLLVQVNHSSIIHAFLYMQTTNLGRGNESSFAVSGSHDQYGRHARIW